MRRGRGSRVRVPPWAVTTAWAIARPRPVDPVAPLREASPRVNRWNRLSRSAGRDAGSVVGHLHHHLVAGAPDADGHGRPGGGVQTGVRQQVGQHLAQAVVVADDQDVLVEVVLVRRRQVERASRGRGRRRARR